MRVLILARSLSHLTARLARALGLAGPSVYIPFSTTDANDVAGFRGSAVCVSRRWRVCIEWVDNRDGSDYRNWGVRGQSEDFPPESPLERVNFGLGLAVDVKHKDEVVDGAEH